MPALRQAILLAGGRGSRLGDLTHGMPKPLLTVAGVPFIEHLLHNLRRHGVERVLVSIGYLSERFVEPLGDGRAFSLALDYVVEPRPLGTGGALALARDRLDETFLALNADTLFDVDYADLAALLESSSAGAAMALATVPDTARYARVQLAGTRVLALASGEPGPGPINGGVYALRREALAALPDGPSSLERDLLPSLARDGKLAARTYDGLFVDIGVPSDLERAQSLVAAWRAHPSFQPLR